MKSLKFIFLSLLGLYLFLGSVMSGRAGETEDQSLYGELLDKYVKNGVVDYQGFKNEEATLDKYLKILENTNVRGLSRDEQFAFYVNSYNAWTIKLILGAYPGIKSIKDLGNIFKSPWEKEIVRVDGKVISLDDVEHKILRKKFKDPRIHFAVNCASKSCPPLISEPYSGNNLSQQLDHSTRTFVNDPRSNYLKGNKLYVSKIFKWFPEDFDDDIVGFVLKYAEGDFKKELEARKDKIKIKYLHYDWSLNGA
jgi:hypothetical protein